MSDPRETFTVKTEAPLHRRTTVFTHVSDAGEITHFNIDLMTEIAFAAVQEGLIEVVHANVDPKHAAFCRAHRGIEQHRLDRIDVHAFLTPIFVCDDFGHDSTSLLVDGHHRYVWAAEHGWEVIPAVILPPAVWQRCLIVIEGLPDVETVLSSHSGIA